jgi:mono/diheme cytochrome c family protein
MRIAIMALLGLISSLAGFGQEKKPEITYTASLSGPEMFKSLCATCHGTSAKGDGPTASALKKAPPDLTVLSKKNGGKFPTERVRNFIDGTKLAGAHGSREMPIWGDALKAIDASQEGITYRVTALATYIESIQAK